MTNMLERRERAAESAFVRAEETRFLARRAGVEALAGWAAEGMGLKDTARAAYVDAIGARFLTGARESDIILRVGSDMERAGKPALATNVDVVYARAVAEASGGTRGRA